MKLIYCNSSARALSVLVIILICAGCKREEPIPEVKPLLKTNQAIVNTESDGGITIMGEFILPGHYRSIQYGFDIDTYANFPEPIILHAGTDAEPRKFEATAQVALKSGVNYYARTWAKTERYEVFGNTIAFQSNGSSSPEIEKVVPVVVFWGDTIMISGKHFDYYGKDNKVTFNEELSLKTWGNKDTIWAVVPVVPSSQNFKIEVNIEVFDNHTKEGYSLEIAQPIISTVSATEGQYPDMVIVTGNNFSHSNTELLVDGTKVRLLYLSKKSFCFIVPYLKSERNVKIVLNSFAGSYILNENFHYFEQKIFSPLKPGWIGARNKLYGKNIDFRKILFELKNGDKSLQITQKWKDSTEFILVGKFEASTFNLDLLFGEIDGINSPWPLYKFADRVDIDHRAPLLETLGKKEYRYYEQISWQCWGIYFNEANAGYWIKSQDGSVNMTGTGINLFPTPDLTPGNYTLQLFSGSRLSNIEAFTVSEPKIVGVTPALFTRDNLLQISGENLPVYTYYQFTHLSSGRKFYRPNMRQESSMQQIDPISLIGNGDYQVEIKVKDKLYLFPGVIQFEDYFNYYTKAKDSFLSSPSAGCGFAIGDNLYILQYNEMSIVNIATGRVHMKTGFNYFTHQPLFLNNKIYMNIQKVDGSRLLCEFNEINEEWDPLINDGIAAGEALLGNGVFNDHLIMISTTGTVYSLGQQWAKMGKLDKAPSAIDYVYSKNGYLYLCDFYSGDIAVVSTSEWKVIKHIDMPHHYGGMSKYIFEYKDELYYCATPNDFNSYGDIHSEMYKFTSQETFEVLFPKKMEYNYYYHFCPDSNGTVYFVSEGYVYKFNP